MRPPVVIEVRDLYKSFRIPEERVDSLKERLTQPFRRIPYRDLRALDGVSFEVYEGEFFGIVGRNGSGKSTLLKVLASIYGADAGRVRTAGTVAPFIELGVGFNPELVARENIALNGVLMGLSRREAARRYDAVLDFAELREFADLKVKNYSSGMMVRLAFAIMVQADADIMLIDEVLAVGDAAFAQRCMDVFHERRRAGRTIVLVTHDMATVQDLCDRAMLLHDGSMQFLGDPEDAALRYFRLNFATEMPQAPGAAPAVAVPGWNVALVEARLLDAGGVRAENVEQGDPIIFDVEVKSLQPMDGADFVLQLRNEDNLTVTSLTRLLEAPVAEGVCVRVAGRIENKLVPGRYNLDCWVGRHQHGGDRAVQGIRLLEFVVFGTGDREGVVTLDADVSVAVERRPA